jgi:hypothetical protein
MKKKLPKAKEGQELLTFMTTVAIEESVRSGIFELGKGVTLKKLALTEYHALTVYLVFKAGRWIVKELTGEELTEIELAGVVVVGSIIAPFAAGGILINAVIDALLPSNSESSNSDYDDKGSSSYRSSHGFGMGEFD